MTNDELVELLQQKGIVNAEVLAAIRATPRHLFVNPDLISSAYTDHALPLSHRQTISQPYIVARMTELLLAAGKLNKVLEIGTGSGYQAAVLARLVPEVYSIERIQPLLLRARKCFEKLKLDNIHSRFGDGNAGWVEAAPFNGIIVTAAATQIPNALMEQLSIGGRMVMPLGDSYFQQLKLIIRLAENKYTSETLDPVVFVPLLKDTEAE